MHDDARLDDPVRAEVQRFMSLASSSALEEAFREDIPRLLLEVRSGSHHKKPAPAEARSGRSEKFSSSPLKVGFFELTR
jgi:hypothetical protein